MQTSKYIGFACTLLALMSIWWPGSAPSYARTAGASNSRTLIVQPGGGISPITSLIRSARHSLRLEIYLLTDREIVSALAQARHRGVDVRVVLEERPYGYAQGATRAYDELRQAGVPVHWANEGVFTFTHTKTLEVDGKTAGIFTFNLSSSGFFRNREFGIIDRSSVDASAVGGIIDADWNQRSVRVTNSSLVVSPLNSRADLQGLIDGARHTLDLYAEEVQDGSIESHLVRAARRGVRVRLITSGTSAGVDDIRAGGVSVTLMQRPYVHAKAIVADSRRLFVGSENLSTTSLDQNREIGLVLSDSSLASQIERTFGADWAGSTAPPNATTPPTIAPAPGRGLSVRVSASPATVRRGELLTISGYTRSGASCGIEVIYPDGYVSHAYSLSVTRVAGSDGMVAWSWHVGSTVTGAAHAIVRCSRDSAAGSGETSFLIE
jgi:phosphatidylserine/phosphatidylglycerophosphate/cardiolipin synthase-like enzyme